MQLQEKAARLIQYIKQKQSAVVAFSGGVDSSFLCKMVYNCLGSASLAITVDSMLIPRSEIEQAKELAAEIGIRHRIVEMKSLSPEILNNDEQRCYHCKKNVFGKLVQISQAEKITTLFDGSNLDDLSDYRPGMRALAEMNIESPLLTFQFTKQDIRTASRELGLSTWDHPSLACLASRVPCHVRLTKTALTMVEQSEAFLRSLGLKQLRVRYHQDLARIEVARKERGKLLNLALMDQISEKLKSIGFRYVSLDLDGYQTGKMTPESILNLQ